MQGSGQFHVVSGKPDFCGYPVISISEIIPAVETEETYYREGLLVK